MQVGGPQEERSKRLFREPADAPFPTTKEREFVVPVDFRVQEETYQEKVSAQNDEIAFLKSYIERILNQLRRVLIKHDELDQLQTLCDPTRAQFNPADDDDDGDGSLASPPWFSSKEYMSPLFAAYESRIKELETTCEKTRKDMDSFVAQASHLATENDRLQEELTTALEKLILHSDLHASHRGDFYSIGGGRSDAAAGDQLAEMNERLDILMSENTLLVEQVSLQESELEECQKDIQERDGQLVTMSQNFNQATVAIQELREMCDHMKQEKHKCEAQVQKFAATIAQLEAQKETILEHVQGHKTTAANYEKQIDEYEATLAGIKKAAEQKQALVTQRYEGLCARLRELTSALESKDKQVDEWHERHRAVTAELDLVKHDCEGMIKVMHGMEKQLNEYAAREDAVADLERATLEKAQAAALERDQAMAKESQCRREIARLLEQKRVAASEYLKATDEAIDKVRRKLEHEIQHRLNEVKHAQATIVTLKMQLETVTRLQVDAEKQARESCVQGEARYQTFHDKYQQLVDRLAVADQIRDDAVAKEAKMASMLAAKEGQFDKALADTTEKLGVELERLGALQRELEVRRSELREAAESIAAKDKQVAALTKEVADVRTEWNQKHKYQLDMYVEQLRDTKTRLELSENEVMKLKHEATKSEQLFRLELSRMDSKLKSELESASHRTNRLREEKSRVESHLLDLQSKHAVYATKIIGLEQELADAHHQCSQMQMAVEEAERKSYDVGSQLAVILSTQQQSLRADVELKSALDRTKLEKTRLEREVAVLRKNVDDMRQRSTQNVAMKDPHAFLLPVEKIGT
ncbi:Aste57867_12932 [Aphanomyces stellatus]|uniref:Aste57867_12932 protein n=1 Tax=Aphanomyces stellatus TaxID=120398 RepID=A0A485KYX0_9STRA|nr:hypothetical protein As57867_012884 [Aphanomyces stellatus]VFT89778.1 Aste57867_12932 [Aphanomyces stellatus]